MKTIISVTASYTAHYDRLSTGEMSVNRKYALIARIYCHILILYAFEESSLCNLPTSWSNK